jgi:phosphoglycolate phosphatase
MLNKYEHIIWDWNGTIFDDLDLSISIINGLLKKYNLKELEREEYRNYFTMPVRNYYSQIGFDFTKYSFEEVGKEWIDEYERRKFESGLYNGIEKILTKINSLGIGQSILSAYSQHTLEEMVNHFGIRHLFDYVFGLDNIYAASKIQLGKQLIEKIGDKKVLLIGDIVHDFEVATELGADCILLASGHQSEAKLIEESRGMANVIIIPSIDALGL